MQRESRRVIVVGSGPAGAMSALKLVACGIPVTMLEAGAQPPRGLLIRVLGRNVVHRFPPLPDRKNYVASGDPATVWYHELIPGGMSNHWTGAVPRFAPEDFCEGERLHECYRWPVSYEELVPYYEEVEGIVGVAGDPRCVPNLPAAKIAFQRRLPKDWQRLAAQAELSGQGFVPTPIVDGRPWMFTRSTTAFNSFRSIIRRLLASPNFELILGAHALRIEYSSEKQRASSVVYYDRHSGCERRADGAAIVLAAGPLASTKLLLDSACPAFPEGLGNREGVLGKYLHDHPKDWCEVELDGSLRRLGYPVYLTRAPYAESSPLLAASCTLLNARSTAEKLLTFLPTRSNWLGALIFGTVIPSEDGYVRLDSTRKDEFGLPVLDIHVRYDEQAAQNTVAARARLVEVLESAGYRCTVRFTLPHPEPPGASVHFGGTVRMHRSPRYGMLNTWNRLHAVDNVVVADASCFTTGVEKNPTLTVMALAARAADRLAKDLKASAGTLAGSGV